MGNDGGSIPKRIDLVKEKAKEIKKDTLTINQNRSRYCAISNSKLQAPIVGCKLGYLYNKEALLSCLINKAVPSTFSHISKLKDVKDLVTTPNSDRNSPNPLICPLTRLEFNGLNKFLFFWKCGCMIAEKGLASAKTQNCPLCGTEYKSSDVVHLNMSYEEVEAKRKAILDAKSATSQNAVKETTKEEKNSDIKENLSDSKRDLHNTDSSTLGKREVKDLESYLLPTAGSNANNQKDKTEEEKPLNILDRLGSSNQPKGSNILTLVFADMFHKHKSVEDAKGLFFRNCRYGIR